MRRWSRIDSLIFVAAVLGAGPGCHTGPDEKATSAAGSKKPSGGTFAACNGAPVPAKPAKPASVPARIFTDITPTMQGFAGYGGKATSLREIHRSIDVAVGEAGAPSPRRCSLGAQWKCATWNDAEKKCDSYYTTPAVQCDEKVTPDYGAPTTYLAANDTSKLDEVLVRKPVPEKVVADAPPAPDWLDDAGLTVIVSSGLEPGPITTPPSVSPAESCKAGPSPACITRSLVERTKEGFGAWLITANLPFDGSYVADVPVDAKYLESAKTHVADLKKIATGETTPYFGLDLEVRAQQQIWSTTRGPGYSRFSYKGVRPLLIVAMSRNPDTGRAFAKSLVDKLRADPALRPGKLSAEEAFASIELGPLAGSTFAPGALELLSKDAEPQKGLDPAELAEFRFGGGGASERGAWSDVSCGAKGKGWLLARYATTPGAVALPPYVKETVRLEGPSSDEPLPAMVSHQERVEGQPAFRVFVGCGPLATRSEPWAVEYLLYGKSELDEKALEATWLARASAPNVYEMPERTYGLREVATAVLKQAVTRDTCASRVRVTVKRSE
jgi:hypothetical protein